MLQKEFVPKELATKLKELGFDEPVLVEKTLHTLSIYATINEKLQESGYEPITFQRAVELGLNEKTQESDVESFVEYFYMKEDREMNNKDETLPC